MIWKRRFIGIVITAAAVLSAQYGLAGDLKIMIPRPSKLTPVQRLNREGVEAVKRHKYSKAEKLFYQAYLFDPQDAFTLNNLGYVAEMQGQIDRAEQYYQLAAAQSTEATVDIASAAQVKGKPMRDALALTSAPLQVNHANVEAVRLLAQGRAPEADLLLADALKTDPHNIFSLNNMGVAKEMEGEEQEALQFFDQAAAVQGNATAVVTTNPTWRGRQVTSMAEQNAKALREHLAHEKDLSEQVAELNLRGVSAVNRNDLRSAADAFQEAYKLDPNDAFTLNNIGYVYELEGDRETAQFYYEHARLAGGANATVGVASRRTAEGQKLFAVAQDSDSRVDHKIAQERQQVLQQNEPVVLRRRDNSVVDESIQAAPPAIKPETEKR